MTNSQPGVPKTGPLRYTDHYVFNSADCLGKGATASVYLGRHKDTGNIVAIKVFNAFGCRQIGLSRNRELELLPSISHKNLMTFIACEKERESNQDVLVMEYCQGGSLYTLLEQPQNAFGLQEKEFLRFLSDLSNGLKYLCSRGIIHRDIKPGNIMKRIEEDGSASFVLTDFGASRELGDDETFMSLHGTEEYLHPEMYQLAVLRQPGNQRFTSVTDLWSLAVTVYHVATGRLPFQPHGGRANTQTMYQITSSLQSGIISGVQQQAGGSITWSRQLPATCHLSESLRRLLEPILAGLFERDPKKALSFERYFDLVSDIMSMKTMKVFNTQRGLNLTVYLRQQENYTDLQERLASLTEIPAHNQLILLSHRDLATIVDPRDQIGQYPKSVLNAKLFVLEKEDYEIHRLLPPALPPFPPLSEHSTVAQNASIAKKCAAVAYFLKAQTEVVLAAQEQMREASECLRLYVNDKLKPLDLCVSKLDLVLKLTEKRFANLHVSQAILVAVSKLMELTDCSQSTELHSNQRLDFCSTESLLDGIIQKAVARLEEIKVYKSVLVQRMKEQELTYNCQDSGCKEEDHCLSKINQVCQDTQSVANTFARHKKYGELHPHEQFIHKVERQRLSDMCVRLLSLYQGHCLHGLTQVHQAEQKQSSTLMRHLTRAGKVETNVKCVAECQQQITDKLDKLDSICQSLSQTMTKRIHNFISGNHLTIPNGTRHFTSASCDTSEKAEIRKPLSPKVKAAEMIDQLVTEINSLQFETSELDRLMKSNTDSLVDLKRMLQETNSLNTESLRREPQ